MNMYFIFNFAVIIAIIFILSLFGILLVKNNKEKKYSIIIAGFGTMLSIFLMTIGISTSTKLYTEPPIVVSTPVEPQIDTVLTVSNGMVDSTYTYYFHQVILNY